MTRVVLALLTSLLSADFAHAQSADARWPERPIRLIVPFTAGSSSDTVARLVAQKLAERFGQPLVAETRVGGGGSIGSGEVARADADGYTLGLATPARTQWRRAWRRSPTIRSRISPRYRCWATRPSCSRSIPACPRTACKS